MRPVLILIIFIATIFIGCGGGDEPNHYYESISTLKDAPVKLERRELDVFNEGLKAVLETATDTTNADTARRFVLEEIERPTDINEGVFYTTVDRLDYDNFVNAVRNFLSQENRVEIPMFYDVNERLGMKFQRDTGLTLMDRETGEYTVAAGSVSDFLVFLMGLPLLAENGSTGGDD